MSHDEPLIDLSDPDVLARYQPYLQMLARVQMRRAYQAKVGHSDIVQQVMVQAVEGRDGFRGKSEGELRAWLRQILARHLCHLDRDMHRGKRDVRREQSMEVKLGHSSMRLEGLLAGDDATPSQNYAAGENVLQMIESLEKLPRDQADAIRLHYLQGMKLAEVAQEMNKTSGAIAGLLHRGMKTLRSEMGL